MLGLGHFKGRVQERGEGGLIDVWSWWVEAGQLMVLISHIALYFSLCVINTATTLLGTPNSIGAPKVNKAQGRDLKHCYNSLKVTMVTHH